MGRPKGSKNKKKKEHEKKEQLIDTTEQRKQPIRNKVVPFAFRSMYFIPGGGNEKPKAD